MNNVTNSNMIRRAIILGIYTFIVCSIIIVFKYSGINQVLAKVLKSLVPVILAIFISFIFEPLINVIIKRNIHRKYATIFVYSFFTILLFVLICILIPLLKEQIGIFINSIPTLLNIVESIGKQIGLDFNNANIAEKTNEIIIDISKSIIAYIGSSLSVIFDLLLAISGALFLSLDFPKFKRKCKEFIPKRIKEPIIFYFQNYLPFIHKYFIGMLLDSILIFLISYIGFALIGIEYSLIISIIIALTNLIPVIGPYIGGIPAAIVGFSISNTIGISAIILVIIVQLLESNIIQPMILKNAIKLHPLEGILGISLFGILFGIIGMIISPILIVGIKLLFLPYKDEHKDVKVKAN